MDDTEDDARYPTNQYGMNEGYESAARSKPPVCNAPYTHEVEDEYIEDNEEDDDDDEEEEEIDEEEDDANAENVATQRTAVVVDVEDEDEDDDMDEVNGNVNANDNDDDDGEDDDDEEEDDDDDDDDDEDDDDDDDDDEDDDDDDDEDDDQNDHTKRSGNGNLQRHQKKRKLKSLLSSYEFAPRVQAPAVTAAPAPPKPSFGGRNSLADWTEHETFVLLEAWGERFLQRGRKSLRSEEWQEVAEKVSQQSKMERTDTQCRNRLDTLKKKYKKEKAKSDENGGGKGKWIYFKKMDLLMSSTPQQQTGLSCGVDSGEYVFMNPKAYLNRANGLDEMRDSPGNSDSPDVDDDSDLLPPKRTRTKRERGNGGSFKLLADSIYKFSEVYEKIESSKRKQMVELEKIWMDFHRDLELQKRQILERAQAEIAKIRQGDYEDNDGSAENGSG